MKQNTPVYSFDKSGYLASSQIQKLYEQKLKTTLDDHIKPQIQKAMFYDPRRNDIYFSSVVASQKGKIIADKLSSMSEEEFLKSDYSYLWINELAGDSIFKVVNPSVLTSVQPNDLMRTVLDIVYSSKRKMPAHFTSNEKRTQSFCLDFDISEVDEYEMSSESWSTAPDPSIIKTGEDIMLAAYIAVKLGGEKYIPQLQQKIIENEPQETVDLNKYIEYFQHCAEYGKNRATNYI